jgi:hypothetical protein
MIIGAVGGGFITDDNTNKRIAGFVLVAIAALGVVLQILWQVVDAQYYLH